MIAFTLLTRFIYLDFLSVLSPLAFHFPKLSTRQMISSANQPLRPLPHAHHGETEVGFWALNTPMNDMIYINIYINPTPTRSQYVL
jgi:hypothetical protein